MTNDADQNTLSYNIILFKLKVFISHTQTHTNTQTNTLVITNMTNQM